MKRTNPLPKLSALLVALAVLSGCRVTSHPAGPARLGVVSSPDALEAVLDVPGNVTVERVVAADWAVPLSGLLNLDHPHAEAAGIEDRDESIQIYFYALHHPEHGTFMVDTGVQQAVRTGEETIMSSLVASVMNADAMKVRTDTAAWIATQSAPVSGVFLTHMHLDHVLGLPDVPRGTPIYVGPGESDGSRFLNMFVQGTIDRALEGHETLSTWPMGGPLAAGFAGVIDIFGDGSVWGLHVPGHTPGSMAYIARTPRGPVLLVGDTSHTEWGWKHGVEPGDYTSDHEANVRSLKALKALTARHPTMKVHLGHQSLAPAHAQR